MDVGLGQPRLLDGGQAGGLNPCFSGCWSRTLLMGTCAPAARSVLILVLVDVGLGRGDYD